MRAFALLALLAITLFLNACNTVEGAGEDISRGGEEIADTARDARN